MQFLPPDDWHSHVSSLYPLLCQPCYGALELQRIWAHNPFACHIIFYWRYINAVIIIWDGPQSLVTEFAQHCNNNTFGLSFTYVCDKHSLVFLDLELDSDDHKIITRNHFKPTSGNSYLHFSSCHHPKWIKNISKTQFHRLAQNCPRGTTNNSAKPLSTNL